MPDNSKREQRKARGVKLPKFEDTKPVEEVKVETPVVKAEEVQTTKPAEKPEVEVKSEKPELDSNGKLLTDAFNKYIKAATSGTKKEVKIYKEALLKTIQIVFKRPDLTQATANIVNEFLRVNPYCSELNLLRDLDYKLHGVVSYIHAKLEGKKISVSPIIGNSEKIK